MTHLAVLRSYATKADPTKLPPSVRFDHTATTLTIFDCFPKSIFHFLVLPRPRPTEDVKTLESLGTLLRSDRKQAKEVLIDIGEEAAKLRGQIEEEMLSRYGFKWPIWTGFHAVPSMVYV
jgi:aprataxin